MEWTPIHNHIYLITVFPVMDTCSLNEGGTPPRFLIVDDGWQQIEKKEKDTNTIVQEGAQ